MREDEHQPPIDMLNYAQQAMNHAYVPYSHFAVGACLRSANGELFSGCNVENVSYGMTLCAEAGALSAMIRSGQQRWSEALVISSGNLLCSPCGACRQRLFEFAQPDSICHLCTLAGDYRLVSMSELFPLPFSSLNLSNDPLMG